MAPNRVLDLEPPVTSTEEDEGSESTGSDSESEPEGQQKDNKAAPATPPVTKKPADDESGSDSDSESDLPIGKSLKADPTVKPIASKPMPDTVKPSVKRPRWKPSIPASPTPAKSGAGAKRPAESEPKDTKRAKKKVPVLEDEVNGGRKANTDDQKKQLFQRLWSEDDEIVILKGITDYVAKKGADPVNDMNAFHDFIKKSLHIDVTKTQLQDKVRRLKKKFENNVSKEKEGKDRTFSKAHEQKAFDLSKKIWVPGGKLLGVDSSKVNGSAKKNSNKRAGKSVVSPRVESISTPEVTIAEVVNKARPGQWSGPKRNVQNGRTVADPALEVEILKDGLDLIEGSKRVELEEKWKKLRVEEAELYLKRVELIREQTTLVLEAIKSGEN